jgi:hypothetical protein
MFPVSIIREQSRILQTGRSPRFIRATIGYHVDKNGHPKNDRNQK